MLYQIQMKLIYSLLKIPQPVQIYAFPLNIYLHFYPIESAQQKSESNSKVQRANINVKELGNQDIKLADKRQKTEFTQSIFYQENLRMLAANNEAQRKKIKVQVVSKIINILQGSKEWQRQLLKLQLILKHQKFLHIDPKKEYLYQFVKDQIGLDVFMNIKLNRVWYRNFFNHYLQVNSNKILIDKIFPYTSEEITRALVTLGKFSLNIHEATSPLLWEKQKRQINEEVRVFLDYIGDGLQQYKNRKYSLELFMVFMNWRLQK